MVKTTVYLEDEVAARLKRLSKETGVAQAELIREAVRKRTERVPPPLPAGMGKFRSGFTDTAANKKAILREAALNGSWR